MLKGFEVMFSPFMLRPLVACMLLPGILVYYGLHIVRREVIFVDLALAQVATLGTCVCLLLGHDVGDPNNDFWAVGFTLIGALVFTLTRPPRHGGRVPQEALIGIVYVVAAAASILLLSKSPHGKEELQHTLVGDLLTVSWTDIWKTGVLYVAIGVVHFIFRRQFIRLSFDHDHAAESGLSVRWWDFLFYGLFGLIVTRFVLVGGVLLVFSYLIVPAVCANYLVKGLPLQLAVGWGTAIVASLIGLYGSSELDMPTGAAIVCVLGGVLTVVGVAAKLRGKGRQAVPPGRFQAP